MRVVLANAVRSSLLAMLVNEVLRCERSVGLLEEPVSA
jgi:hypothetical protein